MEVVPWFVKTQGTMSWLDWSLGALAVEEKMFLVFMSKFPHLLDGSIKLLVLTTCKNKHLPLTFLPVCLFKGFWISFLLFRWCFVPWLQVFAWSMACSIHYLTFLSWQVFNNTVLWNRSLFSKLQQINGNNLYTLLFGKLYIYFNSLYRF